MDKTYRVIVEVTYKIEIPVTAKDEESALEKFEKIVHKLDDYEIVNRSVDKTMEIVEVRETYGK